MVLNPKLYNALAKRFGAVAVSNENEPYVGTAKVVVGKSGRKFLTVEDVNYGEQYCVTCPNCGGKNKFTVSYICGTKHPPYDKVVWHKAHCFRCGLGKGSEDVLKSILSGYYKAGTMAGGIRLGLNAANLKPQPLQSPGKLGPLVKGTYGYDYLLGRDLSPEKLAKLYNFKRIIKNDMSFLQERVWIPTYNDGKLLSWQARSCFEYQPPPYYIAKNGKKGLFNIDLASQQDFIVLQEGAFDAIACGLEGVAVFGKSLTHFQHELLSKVKKRIVVMLDPDAAEDAKKIWLKLKETHRGLVSLFNFPTSWPTEYSERKQKEIPCDAASVGHRTIYPLILKHLEKTYGTQTERKGGRICS